LTLPSALYGVKTGSTLVNSGAPAALAMQHATRAMANDFMLAVSWIPGRIQE